MFFLLVALVPTFLISRLILWFLRSWSAGVLRLAVAHSVSLIILAIIGGFGMADGGAFAGTRALGMYVLPQALWFVFDLVRHRKRTRTTA